MIKNRNFILSLSLILFYILVTGCKKNIIPTEQHISDKRVTDSLNQTNTNEFELKLQNKEKIFLKYWAGLTFKEFTEISNILVKEGVIEKEGEDFYININGSRALVLPSDIKHNQFVPIDKLSEKKFDGILLKAIDKNIYNTYQKKYRLKALSYRTVFSGYHIEENPHYYNYQGDTLLASISTKVIKNVYASEVDLNSFIDKFETSDKYYLTRDLSFLKSEVFKFPGEQEISNKKNIILIREDPFSIGDRHQDKIFIYEKISSIQTNESIIKQAKYRTRINWQIPKIEIFYTSKELYQKVLDIEKNKVEENELKNQENLKKGIKNIELI